MLERTLAEQRQDLRAGEYSSVELTENYLTQIEACQQLNAFITVSDVALEQARAADKQIAAGADKTLLGIPIAHKDIFCQQSVRTTTGSRMLDNFISPYDATVVARLDAAGAISLGKTNMDEFAMGSSNESSYYGPVRNPWNTDRVPGGSSGGSGAAVAADEVIATLGTDTGGSIRQPASFCGCVGIKPTYGRVSRYGVVAFASSLDQVGPMAANVRDATELLEVL